MANYTVKVLRFAFAWGRLHGWGENNPAQGVPLLPRPVDLLPRPALRIRAKCRHRHEVSIT